MISDELRFNENQVLGMQTEPSVNILKSAALLSTFDTNIVCSILS